MRKFIILVFCLLAVSVAFNTLGIASGNGFEMRVPMGTLVLKPPSSVEPKKANVEFPHSRHFSEVRCYTCHHNWDGVTPIQSCMASNCHDSTAPTSKLNTTTSENDENDMPICYYKKAYHTQCIECHKTLKEEFEKMEHSLSRLNTKIPSAKPTGCVECHPK